MDENSAPLMNRSGSNPQTCMLVNPSTLIVHHVRLGDEGNYTCVVSNILGDDNATFILVLVSETNKIRLLELEKFASISKSTFHVCFLFRFVI